jgi:glyoxylase-like metal-dependent hydrolase (beta-lactamase superfamily II)
MTSRHLELEALTEAAQWPGASPVTQFVLAAQQAAPGSGVVAGYLVSDEEGFRFGPPRLTRRAEGVYTAHNFDFGDFSFVITGNGVVAIDTGSTPGHAATAVQALREYTTLPVTHVILTHAHLDHVGGLRAFPGAQVIAQAGFTAELATLNDLPMLWRRFLPAGATHRHHIQPDRLVDTPTTVDIDGVEFVLYPVHGGETDDALLVHVPARGVVFTGDILMPYFGAPFFAEGSPEGLFDAMRLVEDLAPDLVIHGHSPITDLFGVTVFPALRAALEDLYSVVRDDLRAGRTLTELLHRNHLPEVLRSAPDAVVPYVVMREGLVKRVHRQHTGYWQPDGEGIEHLSADDWAAALDLLAGGNAAAHAHTIRTLLDRGDLAMALRLADSALATHDDADIADLRQQTLTRLMERHQGLNPFKFLIYSELAGYDREPASTT